MGNSFQKIGRLTSHRCTVSQNVEAIIQLQKKKETNKKKGINLKIKSNACHLPMTPFLLHFRNSTPPIEIIKIKQTEKAYIS